MTPSQLSPEIETEIETIIHMVGDRISRDQFSVEAVTSDLNDRLYRLCANIK